jgi:hypothetical protein
MIGKTKYQNIMMSSENKGTIFEQRLPIPDLATRHFRKQASGGILSSSKGARYGHKRC